MAKIPFQTQQAVGVATPQNPRMSAEAAQAPYKALAGVGQAVTGVGKQIGQIAAKKQDQNDSVLASKYENSYVAQKAEVDNFRLRQKESGENVTPEQVEEINQRYTLEREGYVEGMTGGKQEKYGIDLEHKTGIINQGSQNFFLKQEIEANTAEFQVNYDKLLRANKFDEADALVEEAGWMTEAEKIGVKEQGRISVHTAQMSDEYGYSESVRQSFDDKETGWMESVGSLELRNQQIKESSAFTQDEKLKLTRRNINAMESIRKQAQTEVNTIVGVAFAQAKDGNSIQSILDEQGPLIESVYPQRLRALENFENSRTMVEIQEDAVKKEEATTTALWRLNTNRGDLAKRVAKQTSLWQTKFFDPNDAEDVDTLINDVLSDENIPKEDKGILAQLLVEKNQNRISGYSKDLSPYRQYTGLAEAYGKASADSGNPNYWNTFFEDYQEMRDYSSEHGVKEGDIFAQQKIQSITDKANSDITQSILGAKARGRQAEETFSQQPVTFEDILNQIGL